MRIILLLDPDTNVRLYVCLDPNMYEALFFFVFFEGPEVELHYEALICIYIGMHGEVVDFKHYMHLLIASL
jgi:hypothetical protein